MRAAVRGNRRVAALAGTAIRGVVSAAVVVLVAFHAWLLALHLASGQLLEPAVALRWFAGTLIVAGFVTLRRLGEPLFRSRRAVVLWLFVVLLHWHAVAAPANLAADMAAAVPEVVTVVAAPGAVTSFLGALALLLLARLVERRYSGPRAARPAVAGIAACGGLRTGFVPQSSVRPPPR